MYIYLARLKLRHVQYQDFVVRKILTIYMELMLMEVI